ncbi:integrase, catalytic region, zinc finger, CCHC-type containing protein [Tanacetum coccineum]
MANLSSEDPIYDEAGPSYDSNTPFEVQDHDTFVDHMDEYHEVHEMQNDVQHNYVVDSDADYTSDSNIIPYDQYVEDNEEHVVQSNVSSVRNDALMSILDEMHEQGVQSRSANKQVKVVNDTLTSELARYKELVGVYEQRAKFELTDRERKIDEQMRIIISDRNRKETSLKSELHSAQLQLRSTTDVLSNQEERDSFMFNMLAHLPQTNNQLRTSSNARNNATVQDGRVVVQDVRGGQNRVGNINPGQAKPIKCYNCNGIRHITRQCPQPKRPQDSNYFKDKMLLMNAHENGAVLDEEQLLFLAGEQVTNFDDDVDDLALNVDHVFEADQCDAFDSDVDEAPTTQTMFMANLSSEDPIYDEAGPSYDSNTPFEVQDHDTFVDHMDEYHEVHEMQSDVQHNYVVDSDADYTSDSNIIPYDQYVEDNEEHVVQSNVSSVRNDALMSILDEMHEQGVQSMSANKQVKVVNDTLTSELARYKELVGVYEQRAKFELTDREQKIDEQMRIIISDRNRKETSLKSELHSAQLQLRSTLNHHKIMREEAIILKKDFKQKEDKFLEEFLDIKRLKEKVEDRLYKQDQSVQTVHMICKPKSFYDEKNKVAIGYKNPLCLTRAKQVQPALYNGHVLVMSNHARPVVHDSEDTREISEITRKRMLEKMKSPLYNNDRKKAETSVPKPLSALIVYPPNTPVKLVPRVLPTKSQVKINLYRRFDSPNSQTSQDVPEFNSFFKINNLENQIQEKDNVIRDLKVLVSNVNDRNCEPYNANDVTDLLEQNERLRAEIEKIKNLEHQIQEKDNVIRDLKVLVSNVNDRSCEPYNANDVTDLLEQNERFRAEIEKVKQHYKELYDSIKITRVHTREKTSTMLNEIESLKAQLKSKVSCVTSDSVKPKVLAPGMYAIDVKPIPHPLKNNRSAHLTYINHLKESVETVREIVEEARVVKPLDNALNYACQYTKLSQELLEYVIGTCPKSFNERDNKAPSTPVTRKKQVTFNDKPGTSSSNTQKHEVHQKVQQTNVPVIHSTGVNTSTEASGSKPRSNTKKNRILPAKSENKKKVEDHLRTNKSVWTEVNRADSSISSKRVVIISNSESMCKMCNKCLNSANHEMRVVNILSSVNATLTIKIFLNKGKQIWKPKGKLSDNSLNKTKRVWKATGKLFAEIGYQWRPTGKKFALGEMCPLTKLSVKCRTGHPLVSGLRLSKHMTGNRSKLKNFVVKFIGTVRFGNDHFGAIMGYGDYVIRDSVISRVYYVEGLRHNLFSIGQFCDSDIEVAFRKHTCFVRDINGAELLKGEPSSAQSTSGDEEGIDLEDRLAPVASDRGHQNIIANACNHNEYDHLPVDVINAFLNGDLQDEVLISAKPTKKHLEAINHIFRYLKGTINMGLWYPKDNAMSLTAYVDTDHAGCQDSRRSTSGSAQFLGDRLCNRVLERQKKLRNQIFRALIASADVPSSVTETTDTTSTLPPPPPPLQKPIALTASADVPSSVTETTDTTSTLPPPPPPLQKPTGHRDIWEKVKDQKSRMHH